VLGSCSLYAFALFSQVPIVMESNNPTLLPPSTAAGGTGPASDILDPPKFTYSYLPVANNTVVSDYNEVRYCYARHALYTSACIWRCVRLAEPRTS
jgi:hypothetical protein